MKSKVSSLFASFILASLWLSACGSAPIANPTAPATFGVPTAMTSTLPAPQSKPAHGGPAIQQAAPPYDWIDPNTTPPSGALYKLYDTPARGANTQGSYLIYLPASYAADTARRYPVIYFLHGGFGYQSEGAQVAMVPFIVAIQAGKMPETIIVVPQALPSGWYANSKDGTRPVEDVLIQNLIPHIDATYRTLASANARGIEGMSMGGYGALRLGLKYPTIFGVISAVGSSITKNLSDEPDIRTADTFFGDQAYFESTGPWGIVQSNSAAILAANPKIRILGGDQDGLKAVIDEFNQMLTALNIRHEYAEAPGAGHDYTDILAKIPTDPYLFWKNAFEKVLNR
jgi:enterochelin esterase-like enzyme